MEVESVDADEIGGIAGEQGQAVRERGRGDQRVMRTGGRFASRRAQGGSDTAEGSCGGGVERDDVEIRLGLLKVGLPGRSLSIG